MPVLPPVEMSAIEDPVDYDPSDLEKAILSFVSREWESDRARMQPVYDRHQMVREMSNGWFVRRPQDRGELQEFYIPYVALNQRTRTNIHMSRLIPDPGRMDWVTVRFTGDFLKGDLFDLVERYNAENPPPMVDGPPIVDPVTGGQFPGPPVPGKPYTVQDMVEDLQNRWTLLLRQYLRRSNYLKVRWAMSINRRRYGACYGLVDRKWRVEEVSEDSDAEVERYMDDVLSAAEEETLAEMMGMEPSPAVDVSEPGEGGPVRRMRFDGFVFESISPFNISVGDLECDGGVVELPYIDIYRRRSWRELWSHELRREGDTWVGSYANLECVRYDSQGGVPSFDDRAMGRGSDWKSEASRGFEVPMRIGRFHAEDALLRAKVDATESDWRKFAEKFGFEYEELMESDCWIVEWIHGDGAAQILLRFQPSRLPVDPDNPSSIVESRYWAIDGNTFSYGDHMAGAGELEILANNMMEDQYCQAERITRTMYMMDRMSVDPKYFQENKGSIPFIRDGIIPVERQPINGQVLTPMAPGSETIGVAEKMNLTSVESIRQFTGVAPQMEGASSGADSATESNTQRDYLEQAANAEMLLEEVEVDIPLLRRALAILVDEVNNSGMDGVEIVANEDDLRLWGDRFEGVGQKSFILTSDMVAEGYGIEVLTSSSMGNLGEQLTRLERGIGMAANNYQLLITEGKEPEVWKMLKAYNEKLGLADVFRTLTKRERQQMAMMQQEMMGGGGSDGGAGDPRPGYRRGATELSSPGEPVLGEEIISGTPGVMQ